LVGGFMGDFFVITAKKIETKTGIEKRPAEQKTLSTHF
jgi:hypothetical protein